MPNAAPPRESWLAFANPDNRPFDGEGSTQLVPCGIHWDAVAIHPFDRGLAVLDGIRLPLHAGYRVIADYDRSEVYVLVHPGSGHLCTAPGMRTLGRGSWLLLPTGDLGAGSLSAAWLSPPGGSTPLVSAVQLAAALRSLDG